jgi:pyruvate kinase
MRPLSPSLVATLGPASWTLAASLRDAGATAFRLNASHLDSPHLDAALRDVRAAVPGAGIVVDLQGAKMRLGRFAPRRLARGERVVLALDGIRGLPLPHPELFEQIGPGETLSVNDGRVRLRVEARADGWVEAMALDDGDLCPRKGVNVLEHPVALEGLTPADRTAVEASRRHGVGTFAYSFMSDGREAAWLRAAAPGCRVVGKVERREAAAALETIAARVDEVWICRGDLGAQLGLPQLARFVGSVEPRSLPSPVLVAGQVFEHLTRQQEPTRSEVCHLFDLLARGYAGVVLSDETAIGADPVRAVGVTSSLIREVSRVLPSGS